jgi:hypothetical protein
MRTAILFLFIVMTFYCYGAGMMDYFGIYEPWKLIDDETFAAFHQYQGRRVMYIFVIPSAVMTLLNILAVFFPAHYADRRWLYTSLAAYTLDWVFSFTTQIPIQLELEKGKNILLINDLLRSNWWRFAADTIQFASVCVLLWQLLKQFEYKKYKTPDYANV